MHTRVWKGDGINDAETGPIKKHNSNQQRERTTSRLSV